MWTYNTNGGNILGVNKYVQNMEIVQSGLTYIFPAPILETAYFQAPLKLSVLPQMVREVLS